MSRREETHIVPGVLNAVAHQIGLEKTETDKDQKSYSDSFVSWFLEKSLRFGHRKNNASKCSSDSTNNISFSSVLLSHSTHEVLADKHLSKLVLVESEDRVVVQHVVYKACNAHGHTSKSNCEPESRVDQVRSELSYKANKEE